MTRAVVTRPGSTASKDPCDSSTRPPVAIFFIFSMNFLTGAIGSWVLEIASSGGVSEFVRINSAVVACDAFTQLLIPTHLDDLGDANSVDDGGEECEHGFGVGEELDEKDGLEIDFHQRLSDPHRGQELPEWHQEVT